MNARLTTAAAIAALSLLAASCAPRPQPPVPVPPPPAPEVTPVPKPPVTPVPEPAPAPLPGEPRFTVGLAWDLDTLSLDPVGAAEVLHGDTRRLAAGSWLRAAVANGRVTVRARGADAWELTLGPADTLWVRGIEGAEDGDARLTRWNGRTWRGEMKLFVNPRGKLTLASRLPIETYLLGVLPGEIGPLADDLLEAGRAQAIAARSFTLFYKGRRGVEGFDLFGTVEDQVYGPVETERPLATRCVRTTVGEVGLWEGQPIRANYSSTCGGIAAEVWEAWPQAALPYLSSHLDRDRGADFCAASPHYRWREEWTPAELLENLRRWGPTWTVPLPAGGLGELLDVKVRSRSRSGRVWLLEVRTTRGRIEIPAHSLRHVLRRGGRSASILRSNLFKIDVQRDPRTKRPLRVIASGAGNGHGVGLCQTGALGMARAGRRGEEILRHYYPGAAVERQY